MIIAADDPALKFLLDHAPDLLPGVPVVFCGVSNDALAARAPRGRFTGVREVMGVGPFLDLAISLHAPRRFFVVSDATLTSSTHRRSHRGLRARAARAWRSSTSTAASCRSTRCWRSCGADTTPRDLLLTTPFTRDHTGQSFTARDSLARIAAASAAPAYSRWRRKWARGWWRAASTPASSTA